MLLIISVLHCTLLSQNSGLLLFFSVRQSKTQRNLEDLVHGHLVFPTLLTEKGPNFAMLQTLAHSILLQETSNRHVTVVAVMHCSRGALLLPQGSCIASRKSIIRA
jgi:hypothetical protein